MPSALPGGGPSPGGEPLTGEVRLGGEPGCWLGGGEHTLPVSVVGDGSRWAVDCYRSLPPPRATAESRPCAA
ncbi:hypothetical protein [Streptomyces flavofungini]|uniref:hypothetical protein n=1 Tax=Streptomyces flavofungini TaxID=68200 RepID=UPI0034DEAD4D